MSVGARLKELRFKKGQSLQQVADAVGASKAHIWELETGKSQNPSLDLLRRMAEHFGITVSSLVGETLEDADEQLLKMHRDLQELSDTDRAVIEDVIASMKKRKVQPHET